MSDNEKCLNPDAIRSQLQRILVSREFVAAQRNHQFLSFVVEETLTGRADRIKAYNIATSVFGRAANFDPQTDPIVRIEASRLRRALEHYYLTEGEHDPLRITVPKGAYVPAFQIADASLLNKKANTNNNFPLVNSRTSSAISPVLFVAAFEEESNQSSFPNFTRGFTRNIIVGLTRFCDLVVYGPETSLRYGADVNPDDLQTDLQIDFVVRGGITLEKDHFHVEVLLSDAQTGRYLWAESFNQPLTPANILSVRDKVAGSIARQLAQPYGVIFSNMAREADGAPPDDLASYDCVVLFYNYWKSYDQILHGQCLTCLEQTIARDPQYAEAHACLSQIYTDSYRFGFKSGNAKADPLHRALTLARRAIELAPNSSRGYHALALVYWFAGDLETSLETLRTGLDFNPNDTEIMADLGHHYALRAEWSRAVPLLEESYRRNPAHPTTYRIGLALFHYANGRYQEALNQARKIEVRQLVYGPILEAISAVELGMHCESETAINKIMAIDPMYGDHIVADLKKRNVHSDLIQLIIEGLRKAGLPGSEIDLKPNQ